MKKKKIAEGRKRLKGKVKKWKREEIREEIKKRKKKEE